MACFALYPRFLGLSYVHFCFLLGPAGPVGIQASVPIADIPKGLFSNEEIDSRTHTEALFVNPKACVGCGLCQYRCHVALVKQQRLLSEAAVYVMAGGLDRS